MSVGNLAMIFLDQLFEFGINVGNHAHTQDVGL
jgi:hypothetical protein